MNFLEASFGCPAAGYDRPAPLGSAPAAVEVRMPPRTMIFTAGAAAGPLFRILGGEALLSLGPTAGQACAVAILETGDIAGLPLDGRHFCNVMSLTAIRLERLIEPRLSDIAEASLGLLHDSYSRSARFADRDAPERLADFLLERAARSPSFPEKRSTIDVHAPLKRFELASYLCMTGETLSRSIRSLRERGLIETPSASVFRLIDPGALRALSS